MNPNRRVYWIVILFCLAGYGWLGYNMFGSADSDFTVCTFKTVTGYACPSCGISRSLLSMSHGHFAEGIATNPLGLLAAVFLIAAPIWVMVDFCLKKETLPKYYKKSEMILRTPGVYVPLIMLVLLNWYWNIIKEL